VPIDRPRHREYYSVRYISPREDVHVMRHRDVGTLVRELRARLGLTQERLAQELGVSFSTVNGWENGKRAPQPYLRRRLQEMATAAGVPAKLAGAGGGRSGR
jgi:DNA-binding XRE family transcriptional regulator